MAPLAPSAPRAEFVAWRAEYVPEDLDEDKASDVRTLLKRTPDQLESAELLGSHDVRVVGEVANAADHAPGVLPERHRPTTRRSDPVRCPRIMAGLAARGAAGCWSAARTCDPPLMKLSLICDSRKA